MPPFSRPLSFCTPPLLRPQTCPQCFRTTKQLRSLTTSLRNQYPNKLASKKVQSPFKPKPLRKSPPPSNPTAPSNQPKPVQVNPAYTVEHLAANPSLISPFLLNARLKGPQLIYEAPSHRMYVASAFTLATFFMGYGAWAGAQYAVPNEGIGYWVPVAFGIGASALFTVGVWTLAATTGLLKRIYAVPQGGTKPLLLRIEGSRWVPWRKHTIDVPYSDVSLTRSLKESAIPPRKQKVPLHKYSLLARPFVRMRRWIASFGIETRDMFIRANMITLLAEDPDKKGTRKFKLDVRGSAFGGVTGLDRLIPARTFGGR